MTGQAAEMAGDGGPAGVERARGRGERGNPFPVHPQGNRAQAAVLEVGLPVTAKKGESNRGSQQLQGEEGQRGAGQSSSRQISEARQGPGVCAVQGVGPSRCPVLNGGEGPPMLCELRDSSLSLQVKVGGTAPPNGTRLLGVTDGLLHLSASVGKGLGPGLKATPGGHTLFCWGHFFGGTEY